MLEATGYNEFSRMQSQHPGAPGAALRVDEPEMMDTRFGAVRVFRDNPIIFTRGLLGIPNSQNFCLTEFPAEQLHAFQLLQSLDDANLSFITMPLALENHFIEKADLLKAAEDAGVAEKDLAILLIVSVHRSPSAVQMSVNVRAPLLVNASQRQAVQYVFQHSRYKVQHLLELR